jgi:hypothetical protein
MKRALLFAFLLSILPLPSYGRLCADEGEETTKKTIAVIGSSVAAGWVTNFEAKHDMRNGWAWRLGRLLETRGYKTVNVSIPGDTTAGVQQRLSGDLASIAPDFVIIGLSMGNEGLADGDASAVTKTFGDGMCRIIELCRAREMIPVVGSCYSCDDYNPAHYECIRKMNLTQNGWDVPIINLLGGLDEGHGHFPAGYTYDEGHPDNRGHEELFFTVVPTLFDALAAGKPKPERARGAGALTIEAGAHPAPLSFVPDDVIHSFSLGFSFRTENPGTLATVRSIEGMAVLSVTAEGKLAYRTSEGATVVSGKKVADGAWHDLVLSHRHLAGETLLFVDGLQAGAVRERLVPSRFLLGGSGSTPAPAAPRRAAYRHLLVYRSALNADEVCALRDGTLLRGSLEIYAPLLKPVVPGEPVENRARSLSQLIACPAECAGALDRIDGKIAAAAKARAAEMVVEEKQPVDIDPAQYKKIVGEYEIAPGARIKVLREKNRLFIRMPGQPPVELLPESEVRFFVRFPLEEITVTFEKNDAGEVTRLVVAIGEEKIPAGRVDQPARR